MGRNFKFFFMLAFIGILAASCNAVSKYRVPDLEGLEFEEAMARLNTPEKVNAWLVKNFTYDWKKANKIIGIHMGQWDFWTNVIKYPSQTYHDKKGVCHDAANLAGYALHKAGYKVKIVTAKFRGTSAKGFEGHTVCAFERKGKWWVIGDTRGRNGRVKEYIEGPFRSIKDVAMYASGDCLKTFHTNCRKFEGEVWERPKLYQSKEEWERAQKKTKKE